MINLFTFVILSEVWVSVISERYVTQQPTLSSNSFLFRSTHVPTCIFHVLSCAECSSVNLILYLGKKVTSKA